MPAHSRQGSEGFTLIELTVVLLIVIILMTLGASVVNLTVENAALSQTRRKQDAIRDALTTYLGKYKRLPCPDLPGAPGNVAGTGDDNRATAGDPTTQCSSDVGVLPYVDLGVPRDFVLDGWENFFTYRVTTDSNPVLDWARSTNFAAGKPGKLDVSLRSPATNATTSSLTPAPAHAVAVVLSHGRNGLGAWTTQGTRNVLPDAGTDERANADASGAFIQREISDTNVPTYGPFDDLVAYITSSDLIASLVKDGTVRTAEGETNYQMGLISDEAIGAFVKDCAGTVAPPPTARTDGWGQPIRFEACNFPITSSTAPATTALNIVSGGKDSAITTGACASTDPADTGLQITAGTLQTLCAKVGKTLP